MTTAVVVLAVAGLAAVAYFTPLMSVRKVAVSGVSQHSGLTAEQVTAHAGVPKGRPLLQVNTAEAARRVASIAEVETARVRRQYPSTIEVIVVERTPVARVETDNAVHVLDRLAVPYRHYERGVAVPREVARLPLLKTPNPGPTDPATKAALRVVTELPPDLRGRIASVNAESPVNITFALRNDATVVWGDATRGADKAIAWRAISTRKGTLYNVSSPDFPSYR
ncbi:FtsQ-type POTRA domain-containing protein [Gordonia araii NBRC 100433]|nr:FtsQ-type POTRA domain-containing protein [Gordonia araii]NNG98511.1 FtsQ-type POTRA domain-containing protein [Gordonia araii NBRC 100433]